MSNKNNLKEEIHRMNGLVGLMDLSINELLDLKEANEEISKENLMEIQSIFQELRAIWKIVNINI